MAPRKDLLNIVLGNPHPFFEKDIDLEYGQKFLDVFKARGFLDIDTAQAYVFGQENFGRVKAKEQGFNIDTKVGALAPGALSAENIHAAIKQSLELLGTNKINIYYLHAPDRSTPFEETLKALNEEYKLGRFEKLGISNYTAEEVRQIVEISDKNGFVRPTVYQGNYNLLTRNGEKELFPLLRKEKIAFYAYSPLAAGLLTGKNLNKEDLIANTSRYGHAWMGPIFLNLFSKDSIFEGLRELVDFLKKFNLTPTEVAFRWLAYHSLLSKEQGDAIILGASKPEQFESSLNDLEKGPLPDEVVSFLDQRLWEKVKDESPAYHF